MIATYIELLRHGEATGGRRYRGSLDDPLTTKGWNEMHHALRDDARWTRIVSSPLSRCRDYAEHLAQRKKLPVRIDPRLREIHFGEWEGKTAEELLRVDNERIQDFWRNPEGAPPPRGEPLDAFQARVLDAWEELIGCEPGDSVLVITHAGVMRIILGQVLGLPLPVALQFGIPHAHRVRMQLKDFEKRIFDCELPDRQGPDTC